MDIGPPPTARRPARGRPAAPGARGRGSTRRGGSRAPSSDSAGRASTTPVPRRRDDSGQPDEGSTQTPDAVTIGPMTLRATCRAVDERRRRRARRLPFGAGQEDDFDEDGDEAKILRPRPTRDDLLQRPARPALEHPRRRGDEPGNDDEHGGEGKRTWRSSRCTTRTRTRPRATPARFGGQPQADHEWRAGWQSGSVYVAHSGGTEFVAAPVGGHRRARRRQRPLRLRRQRLRGEGMRKPARHRPRPALARPRHDHRAREQTPRADLTATAASEPPRRAQRRRELPGVVHDPQRGARHRRAPRRPAVPLDRPTQPRRDVMLTRTAAIAGG